MKGLGNLFSINTRASCPLTCRDCRDIMPVDEDVTNIVRTLRPFESVKVNELATRANSSPSDVFFRMTLSNLEARGEIVRPPLVQNEIFRNRFDLQDIEDLLASFKTAQIFVKSEEDHTIVNLTIDDLASISIELTDQQTIDFSNELIKFALDRIGRSIDL